MRRALHGLCAAAAVVFVFLMAGADRAAAQSETAVNIPDENLRAAVATSLSKLPSETITRGDMGSITRLFATGQGIKDLTGLEYAVNLQVLVLNNNEISDISPLSGLTQLATLGLYNNLISDLKPLARLPYLTSLKISRNLISDLTPLAGIVSLTSLELADNRIANLKPLVRLVNLTVLTLQSNRISDLGQGNRT